MLKIMVIHSLPSHY